MSDISKERLLLRATVLERTGIGAVSTLYALMKRGEFPRGVAITRNRDGRPTRVGWAESAVNGWLAERIREAA